MSPGYIRSTFIRPHVNTGYGNDHPDGVNSLPELIEFDAEHNPDHIFGLQSRVGDAPPFEITIAKLQTAVENASGWLVQSGATPGRTSRDTKVPPVAILLGSDIGIFMYMAALNRLGTPVLCLSARLTPVILSRRPIRLQSSLVRK
ncbi:hypothetical protein BDZ89DRAFT_152077 [Hymenopellis radicata]|nr:hypothetical protein BDZ89DRAFT_152077 [Hymenopellis radicata]